MRNVLNTLSLVGLAVILCGCENITSIDVDELSALIEQWELPEEHVWGEGCVFDDAKAADADRSQADYDWPYFANSWVVSGLVAAAIAIPVAIDDADPNEPLSVHDGLRAACLDTCYLADDEEILQLLSIIAQYREEGVDHRKIDLCGVIDEALEPVQREGSLEALPDPREACEECSAALIEYIYLHWGYEDGA